MKQILTIFCVVLLAWTMFGCKEEAPAPKETPKPSEQSAQPAPAQQTMSPGKSGKVTETMDAAGYTYVQVDTGDEVFWAAAPQFAVKVGDEVVVPEGMPMPDYHSKTLDRTFEVVYFVPSVLVGGAQAAESNMPEGHPPMTGDMSGSLPGSTGAPKIESTDIDLSGIVKADGGQTVAEVFAQKNDLVGKPVKVRGKVVKFSPQIMGKNWLHIQDGTGETGANDLTVTTSTTAALGDTVVISGTLATDKDFGYGYKYDLIVEDADVTIE